MVTPSLPSHLVMHFRWFSLNHPLGRFSLVVAMFTTRMKVWNHWVFTLNTTHYTLHTAIAHCTLPLHTTHCTLHTKHYTLHTEHYTLHNVHCTLHAHHCTINTKCIFITAQRTVHNTHSKQRSAHSTLLFCWKHLLLRVYVNIQTQLCSHAWIQVLPRKFCCFK